ncbi:MAG: DUF1810 domain-containing protein [Acetobacteraceae bacterium]|nr:DUF1810 domain-containing protein [Acetobacteraceae bacterium]
MAAPDLDRFVTAQDPVIDTVRRELAAGAKRTHWMWFIFPQLRALGRSQTAKFYGLDGVEEARAYLGHAVLGARLLECTALVNHVQGKTACEIFGSPDDLKFRSCLTLFAAVRAEPFGEALRHYYGGSPDPLTLELLHAA